MQTIVQSETTAARRTVYFLAANSADDSAYTSTLSGSDLRISKAGGAEADSTGTATHLGNGLFSYVLTVAEADTFGPVAVRVAKSGLWGDAVVAQVVAYNPYSIASLGLTNLDSTVSSRLATASYTDADAIWDLADKAETGLTPIQAIRLIAAAIVGETSNVGTSTEQYRAAVSDSKTRLTVTFSASNDRTSVVTDVTT